MAKEELVTYKVHGVNEIMQALEGVKAGVTKRVLRKAVRAAAKPVIKDARENLKSNQTMLTGQLRKSLGIGKVRTGRSAVYAVVGPRKGFSWTDDSGHEHHPEFYGRLIEDGSAFMSPEPFMEEAHRSKEAEARKIMEKTTLKGIDDEVKKAEVKGKSIYG